ncbi:MAG: response regulator [Kofleriaceae bacterium]
MTARVDLAQPTAPTTSAVERPLRHRHTIIFHAMVVATFLGYLPVWWAVGYQVAALVCLLGGLAVGLNAARCALTNRRAGCGALGMAIANLSIIANSALMWREFPILLAWTMFAPVFGWILGSPRQAIAWFVINIALIAIVVAVVLPDGQAPPARLSDTTVLIMTAANAVSMGAVALVAIYMLSQNHRLYLTALRAQQASLEATNQDLATAHRYKDRFFAAVSHELRTPMNAVSGIAELLHDRPDQDAETTALLDTLRASSTQLLHVIDDLLDLTRARENQLALIATDFDLAEAGRAAVTKARAAHPPRAGVGVEVDLGEGPHHVRGDRQRVVQLMAHLIANAFKFTETGQVTVRLTCAAEGDRRAVRVVVRDTGVGIAAPAQARLFDAFTHAGPDQAVRYGGAGLGLPLANHLAGLMGGGLHIESAPGVGTEVVVELALARPAGPADRPTPLATSAPRILVVDDNRVNVLVTVRMLEKLVPGAVLVTAADGAEAVAWVGQAPFDLVLMDMQMPVLDGAGATRRIRAHADPARARIPIVATTANTGSADLQACLDAGMDHALSKPVSLANLAATLARYLPARPAGDVPDAVDDRSRS